MEEKTYCQSNLFDSIDDIPRINEYGKALNSNDEGKTRNDIDPNYRIEVDDYKYSKSNVDISLDGNNYGPRISSLKITNSSSIDLLEGERPNPIDVSITAIYSDGFKCDIPVESVEWDVAVASNTEVTGIYRDVFSDDYIEIKVPLLLPVKSKFSPKTTTFSNELNDVSTLSGDRQKSFAETFTVWFFYVVFALVLSVSIYRFYSEAIKKDPMPMPFGFGFASVVSESMDPTLKLDDLILVVPKDNYEVGNIVVYKLGSMCIVHRIIKIENDIYVTQGDANNAPDEPITQEAIKGEVKLVVPKGAFIINLLSNNYVLAVLIVGFAVITYYICSQLNENKKKKINAYIKKEIVRLAYEN